MKVHQIKSIFGVTLGALCLSSVAVVCANVSATSSSTTASVTVSAACTLSGANHNYYDTISGGETKTFGPSSIKATCNDTAGYSLYAIGFSGDSYSGNNTKMIGTNTNIDTATSGNTSRWSMQVASVPGTYAPTIMNSFDSAHVIPADYAQIAKYTSLTDGGDNAEGSNIQVSYTVSISSTQAVDTYTGKVKYTLVHPNDADAPVKSDQVAVVYNGNGLTFSDGSSTNRVVYAESCENESCTFASTSGTYAETTTWKGYWYARINGSTVWFEDEDDMTDYLEANKASLFGTTITAYASSRAILDIGQNVNVKFKKLAGNDSATYNTLDDAITAIARSDTLPSGFTASSDNIISISTIPVYAWFNDNTIFYYSEADIVSLNADSSNMFNRMRYLSDGSGLVDLDTSGVTNMSNMFILAGTNATTFTLDLSGWDTSSVTNMRSTFWNIGNNATTFDLDLSDWKTSNVTDMNCMFCSAGRGATIWSIDGLSDWDTSNVTDMSNMFGAAGYSATTFTLDLSSWDNSSATDMTSMFRDAGYSATTFTLDLSGWDNSSVTDMSRMFESAGHSATTFNLDLYGWNNSGATKKMSNMFDSAGYSATTFNLDLSSWDTSSVTSMGSMFASAGHDSTTFSLDLSGWDTSSVTSMGSMFNQAGLSAAVWSINGLSDWNTSNVTSMYSMFNYAGHSATTFTLDLSGWDTSSVTMIGIMFQQAGHNATTWSVTIPQTNGNNISNTTSRLYGKTSSYYVSPDSGRSFTLASGF